MLPPLQIVSHSDYDYIHSKSYVPESKTAYNLERRESFGKGHKLYRLLLGLVFSRLTCAKQYSFDQDD